MLLFMALPIVPIRCLLVGGAAYADSQTLLILATEAITQCVKGRAPTITPLVENAEVGRPLQLAVSTTWMVAPSLAVPTPGSRTRTGGLASAVFYVADFGWRDSVTLTPPKKTVQQRPGRRSALR